MIENILSTLREDVWNLIEGKKVPKRDFFTFVVYLLLDRQKFLIKDAKELADKIEKIYTNELGTVEDHIENEYGDMIEVLKNMKEELKEQLKPIIENLETKTKNLYDT